MREVPWPAPDNGDVLCHRPVRSLFKWVLAKAAKHSGDDEKPVGCPWVERGLRQVSPGVSASGVALIRRAAVGAVDAVKAEFEPLASVLER